MTTIKTKIEELLEKRLVVRPGLPDQLLTLFKEEADSLLGEDDKDKHLDYALVDLNAVRNALRAELRERIEKWSSE